MARTDKLKELNDGGYNNLLVVILGGALFYALVKSVSNAQKTAYLNNAGTDPTIQQAQSLRDAMNPTGISWMMAGDFTKVDQLYSTARQITDFNGVVKAYNVLYGTQLATDLQSELSISELEMFYNFIYKRAGTGSVATTSLVGKKAIATTAVNVRMFDTPTRVDHLAKVGETVGTYLSETTLTIPGVGKGVYAKIKGAKGLVLTYYYYVLKSGLRFV